MLIGSISCLNIWDSSFQKLEKESFAGCQTEGDVFTLKPGVLNLHGAIVEEPGVTETTEPGATVTVPATTTTALSTIQHANTCAPVHSGKLLLYSIIYSNNAIHLHITSSGLLP